MENQVIYDPYNKNICQFIRTHQVITERKIDQNRINDILKAAESKNIATCVRKHVQKN